jgi:hypothetical protein
MYFAVEKKKIKKKKRSDISACNNTTLKISEDLHTPPLTK